MKSITYTTVVLLVIMLATWGLNAQPIVGYSELFTFNTKYQISEVVSLTNLTLSSDTDTCFCATQTILVSDFIVENDAIVRLIAGENIQLLPLSQVHNGAQFHAFIDTTGQFCFQTRSLIESMDLYEASPISHSSIQKDGQQFFSLFPNPTPGTFTLQLKDAEESSAITVEIYSTIGERILQTQLPCRQQYEFDLGNKPGGVYLVRVVKGEQVGVEKVVKQ